MESHLLLSSPGTHDAFSTSERRLVGVRVRHEKTATVGGKMPGYRTELSRWLDALEVIVPMVRDTTPRFVPENEPSDMRLPVRTEGE